MGKYSCNGKGPVTCYVSHNWFFLFSTTIFILLLVTSFLAAFNDKIKPESIIVAKQIVALSLAK